MSKVAEPRSKTAPPTEEASISSPSTVDQRHRRPAAEAERPEHASRGPCSGSGRGSPAAPSAVADLDAPAPLGDEHRAALDLDHAADLDVAHRRLAVAQRRRGDRDAAGLEPRHRRPRAVDRIDDQHLVRRSADPVAAPAPGPPSRRRRRARARPGTARGSPPPRASIAKVTSPPAPACDVRAAGVGAEERQHVLAQRRAPARSPAPSSDADATVGDSSSGRSPSFTWTVRRSLPR